MSDSTTHQNFGACVLLINESDQILIGQRQNGFRPGTFGVPGGRVELDEPLVEAAKRELAEETGITANTLQYIGVVREWQGTVNFIHFIYQCTDYTGEPQNMEPHKCLGWQWYDLDALPENIMAGHDAAIDMLIHQDNGLRDIRSGESE